MRKKQLLKDIEKIQNRHSQQDKAISLISETENESEKLTLKKNQLNKNLESKMNEANVTAYKSIH
mgnify:CR=1 FL=1|jgi:hypothetical protein